MCFADFGDAERHKGKEVQHWRFLLVQIADESAAIEPPSLAFKLKFPNKSQTFEELQKKVKTNANKSLTEAEQR